MSIQNSLSGKNNLDVPRIYININKMKKILLLTMFLSTGCIVTENNTERGALNGSLIGGALGAIIGHQSGETGKGALIGAGAGALLGGAVGNQQDKQEKKK
tara:strand:- start:185 stop:487 length:303 start_codon:yes stop_codon:yes gene_type:complete